MLTKLEAWPSLKEKKPMIIAGPCSAETEEQVLQTAHGLKNKNVDVFRAGIWKPRTRPGSFEGVGSIGLPWLKRVKQETGLPIAIEVANVKHVYEALRSGIDILWIGARTTVNPFAIQEIADALKGVDIPVLIKNPINPDVALWLGAIERLEKAGLSRIGAIHRGVSQFDKSIYRNNPEWQMALDLKIQLPDILLINDPSHIAGNRELVSKISQQALDMKFDGLMIETHIDPDNAWSDAAQQVTPEQLGIILNRLIVKTEMPEGVELKNINELRKSIGYIDEQLIDLLGYRMKIVEDIAKFKNNNKMTVLQENRWNELVKNHIEQGMNKGLTTDFITKVFNAVHQESIQRQSILINNLSKSEK